MRPSRVAYAAAIMALGLMGLVAGELAPPWDGIPKGFPARIAVINVCAALEIAVVTACACTFFGARAARWLVIVSLPMFGLSHFAYRDLTAGLVPKWMGFSLGWTYLTAVADIAAATAMLVRIRARLAASLEAAMLGTITVLVWVPRVLATPNDIGNWNELVISAAITAGVWCVADTYAVENGPRRSTHL